MYLCNFMHAIMYGACILCILMTILWWNDWWLVINVTSLIFTVPALIARFMRPTWGPPGANRTQAGPMLVPWTLLSGIINRRLSVGQCTCTNQLLQQKIKYLQCNDNPCNNGAKKTSWVSVACLLNIWLYIFAIKGFEIEVDNIFQTFQLSCDVIVMKCSVRKCLYFQTFRQNRFTATHWWRSCVKKEEHLWCTIVLILGD